MNEERNERPQRRPQQSRPAAPSGRRPAASGTQGARRPAGQPARRPASAQGSRPAARPGSARPQQGSRPAQQRTRTAAAAQQTRRPAPKKVRRNYTRLYLLIGAVAAILLLVFGIWKLKGRNTDGGKQASSAETTVTTTTTEPIVTEPPIVQQITFDTESMYSVVSGAELTDYNGDRKMKVNAPQGTENAAVTWDLTQMVGAGRVADIRTLSMDITCASGGAPIGQCSNALRVVQPAYNAETGVQEGETSFKLSDILLIDNENAANTWHVEINIPKGMLSTEVHQISFVRYADSAPKELYLDNIELLDGYGTPIDITYNASGAQTGANTVPPTDTTTAVPDVTTTVPQ